MKPELDPQTYVVMPEFDPGVEFLLILIVKRRVSHEENVQDHTARPHVRRFTVHVLFYHLWGEVAGRACET